MPACLEVKPGTQLRVLISDHWCLRDEVFKCRRLLGVLGVLGRDGRGWLSLRPLKWPHNYVYVLDNT